MRESKSTACLLLALCRPVSASEKSGDASLSEARSRAETQRLRARTFDCRHESARREALEQLCRVIFNLNEFAYTD